MSVGVAVAVKRADSETVRVFAKDKIRCCHLTVTRVCVMHLKAALPRAYSQLYKHLIGCARFASTSPSTTSTPFLFPAHHNPTPHQIFHLPLNASQADIKARCTSAPASP